jgi:hypothetical protein
MSTLTKASEITNVVGQETSVEFFNRELRNISAGVKLPFLGMYDDTGLGKTHLVKRFLAALPPNVKGITLNLKEKLNLTDCQGKAYFAAITEALAEGVPTIIHLDELGNKTGKGSLQDWIVSHLSKVADGGSLPMHGGDPLPFNPFLLGFVVTSFAPEKIAVDVLDRLKQPADLILTNYSPAELVDILKMAIAREFKENGLPNLKASAASLAMIARSLRGNARQCNDIATELVRTVADKPAFTLNLDTADILTKKVGVYPHGLNLGEVKLLTSLSNGAKNKDTLRAKTGLSKESLFRSINYLEEGTGRGTPFQLCNAEGEAVEGASGPLVDYESAKFHLTLHGAKIVAILRKKGWIA